MMFRRGMAMAGATATGSPMQVTVRASTPSDYNDDGHVDGSDLAVLLGAWGTVSAEIDLSGDGVVDGADLAILLGAWG